METPIIEPLEMSAQQVQNEEYLRLDLKLYIWENLNIPDTDTCTPPSAVVHLTLIKGADSSKIVAKQRPFTGERHEAASNQFDRWIDALRMRRSHPGNPVRNAFELDVKSVHKVPWVYRTCLNPTLLNPYFHRKKATLPTVAEIRQALKGAT